MLRLFWALVNAVLGLWPRLRRLPGKAAVALGAQGLGEPARPARLWRALAIVLPVALLAACASPPPPAPPAPAYVAPAPAPPPARG